MPQRPVGIDMNLSQPNVRPVPPPKKNIIFTFRLIAISEQIYGNAHTYFKTWTICWATSQPEINIPIFSIVIGQQYNFYILVRLPFSPAPLNSSDK